MRIHCPGCEVKLKVSADDADTKINCPKCGERFRPSDADEADDDAPRKSGTRRRREEPEKKGFPVVPVAIAGGATLMLAVLAVILLVLLPGGEKKKPITDDPIAKHNAEVMAGLAQGAPPPAGAAPRQGVGVTAGNNPPSPPSLPSGGPPANPFNGGGTSADPNPPAPPPAAKPPQQKALDDLFQIPVSAQPPKVRAAVLDKDKAAADLDVPTFFSIRKAQQKPTAQPPKASKLTLDEIKAATVYIKVDAGDMSSTGSGFYIGIATESKSVLVATNHHVIDAALKKRLGTDETAEKQTKKPVITCVFNSGVPGKEWASTAKVTAIDPVADLAVLRLDTPRQMPKPIDPWATPKLTETMEVRFCGFPLGAILATGSDNPNITIGNGTISSLRLNKGGTLEQVQISGNMNPGNSGGPLVDKDGRLVGIAQSIINPKLGAGIGFAVPVDELIALLEGKLLLTEFMPAGIEGGAAKFKVVVPIMDPRAQIGAVYVRYWAGKGAKPTGVKDAKIGWKPIPNAEQVKMFVPDLGSALTLAVGDLRLPADAAEVVLQIASETTAGLVAASAPVTYKLKQEDVETGADAKPLADLVNNYAALVGKTAVVKARLLAIEPGGDGYKRLIVTDDNDRVPPGLRFVIDYKTALQLDEIELDDLLKDVRLTCVAGPQGPDGAATVRVSRLDFMEDGGVITKTAPTADTKDPLFALNRDPAKHAGQKQTVKAEAVLVSKLSQADRMLVLFPSLRPPRNLDFALAAGLSKKLTEAEVKPNALYRVRLTVTVEDKPTTGRPAKATVSKIEILDPRGESDDVLKVIE